MWDRKAGGRVSRQIPLVPVYESLQREADADPTLHPSSLTRDTVAQDMYQQYPKAVANHAAVVRQRQTETHTAAHARTYPNDVLTC